MKWMTKALIAGLVLCLQTHQDICFDAKKYYEWESLVLNDCAANCDVWRNRSKDIGLFQDDKGISCWCETKREKVIYGAFYSYPESASVLNTEL